ncbi:MAG: single-stranded-DNA-specific exonuclease RecJ [Tissierellia bacterium]|nr:single-stranded-DNA-specific exonuclease RecJ [Tissierellia bacterium]
MENWFITKKHRDKLPKKNLDILSATKLQILYNRDIVDLKDIEVFFKHPLEKMHDPALFKDMDVFLDRLQTAKEKKEKIVIVGDYDVDGIMSTAVFVKGLRALGFDVTYRLPHRILEGYGLNTAVIDDALSMGGSLIITCDNGVQSFDAVQYANNHGMDVLITDHHEIKQSDGEDVLPNALGVIDPKRSDCAYPFKQLCGAGIVYKIICHLLDLYHYPDENLKDELLSFAAMATICDVVDLLDENRIIVYHGLLQLRNTKNIGLNCLIDIAAIEKERIDTYHIGFVLGPRFNSGGRLDTADIGVQLLLSESIDEAKILASKLNALNDERREFTENGYKLLISKLKNINLGKTIIEFLEDTHESVAGIIAGRAKEQFYRPTIILTRGKEGIKGSGRSIEQFDIYKALQPCEQYLTKFGGHPMACGLSMEEKDIESFKKCFEENCTLKEEDLRKNVYVDALFPLELADRRLLDMINAFKPFGKANDEPLFADTNLEVKNIRIFGENRNVLKLSLKTKTGLLREVVVFESA